MAIVIKEIQVRTRVEKGGGDRGIVTEEMLGRLKREILAEIARTGRRKPVARPKNER